jgi:hypothetical protein
MPHFMKSVTRIGVHWKIKFAPRNASATMPASRMLVVIAPPKFTKTVVNRDGRVNPSQILRDEGCRFYLLALEEILLYGSDRSAIFHCLFKVITGMPLIPNDASEIFVGSAEVLTRDAGNDRGPIPATIHAGDFVRPTLRVGLTLLHRLVRVPTNAILVNDPMETEAAFDILGHLRYWRLLADKRASDRP